MNTGCFDREIKDILLSVQVLDTTGKVRTIPSKDINFGYRKCDLPNDLIFLSASFNGKNKDKKAYLSIESLQNTVLPATAPDQGGGCADRAKILRKCRKVSRKV